MSKHLLKCVCLAGLVGVSMLASAQNSMRFKFDYIGVEGGAFFPSSSLLRDRFGSTIVRVGLTPVMIKRQKDWVPSFEIGFMGASGNGDHFGVFPLTVGVQKTFGDPTQTTVPFIRAGAGVAYFDYHLTKNDLSEVSGHKFGAATALEAGILSGKNFRASVRYYLFSKESGVQFNGFLISATVGVFKL